MERAPLRLLLVAAAAAALLLALDAAAAPRGTEPGAPCSKAGIRLTFPQGVLLCALAHGKLLWRPLDRGKHGSGQATLGGSCPRAGAKTGHPGGTYICARRGSKLVWTELGGGPKKGGASAKAGAPCTRAGQRVDQRGGRLVCTRRGSRLVWRAEKRGKPKGGQAQPRAGTPCPRAGRTAGYPGGTLVCTRAGKKLVWRKSRRKNKGADGQQSDSGDSQPVVWRPSDDIGTFTPSSTPPACPAQPMLKPPVAFDTVKAILYPGQTRGEGQTLPGAPPPGYKPHGGFVFGDASGNLPGNGVNVYAPLDGYVLDASRYLVSGEVQYLFDILNPCGILIRFGHLLTLSPKLQAIADALPPAREGDSRTTEVPGFVQIKTGDLLATRIGLTVLLHNAAMDFGVFDLRVFNAASSRPGYYDKPDNGPGVSSHAVCWLRDWFPAADEAILNALPPGDGVAGKTSDYC